VPVMGPLVIPALPGSLVCLEPLAPRHAADLARAAEEDRSSYGYTLVPSAADVDAYIAAHLARASDGLAPFAQIRTADGAAVGCTALWEPRTWADRPDLRAIEIGWTWLADSAQGTGINKEAKLLLFTYAFETLGVARVDLKTDARNERSRRAIERLGARFEGVLRKWSPSLAPGEEGMLRDSAMFAVVEEDWPTVKSDLIARIGRQTSQWETQAE
jgi:N-acetyltransferase